LELVPRKAKVYKAEASTEKVPDSRLTTSIELTKPLARSPLQSSQGDWQAV